VALRLQTRPGDQAREDLMDINPWTYQIIAKEMIREGNIEPALPAVVTTRRSATSATTSTPWSTRPPSR
jgi:hypothetical protein